MQRNKSNLHWNWEPWGCHRQQYLERSAQIQPRQRPHDYVYLHRTSFDGDYVDYSSFDKCEETQAQEDASMYELSDAERSEKGDKAPNFIYTL